MPRLATHKLLLRLVFTMIPFLILLPCMHSTDLDALLCLKSQLSDSSRALASWSNASLTPCGWQGVRCSTLNASRVVSLDLGSLNLTGQIFPCVAQLDFLDRIHMPNNHLTGHISADIGRLTQLTYLNLSMNSLVGSIPDAISSCSQLETISLESNSLEGEIPQALAECLLLQQIVLSNNNLQGSIPSREHNRYSYMDLYKATDGFCASSILGSGSFGVVYKGNSEFQSIAIKVFKLDQLGASQSFFAECDALRNIRHRNLIRVISLCSTTDPRGNEFKALILEYMEHGNLESWLYPEENKANPKIPLGLGSRITIAMDIAAALDYLHNRCSPPLVHCDLKPRNVLLGEEMVACLSDFGLAKFLHGDSSTGVNKSSNIAGPRGSIGYIAPEYGMGYKISTEGDIYSYGIILLEMIIGKHPTDAMFKDGMNLHNFVETTLSREIGEILEPSFITYDGEGGENLLMAETKWCLTRLAKLGLKCSEISAKSRPTTEDVYAEIISIKENFTALQYRQNKSTSFL
ncbi:hypothetical protein CFC21_095505 [Triticum aestivum]|uniref:non-specific serine/threonine protein kinase n=2 Tax=Triticum aestivum TaxID=4565 RepID=A0A9R1MXH0_WHEAT|nr:receptor kinase-like protein Xa21 isoform X2 [Triticum aestivum]KAF7093071.1 hypothetical protein CFC21_095505 [Triticum aestivum]